MLWQDVISSVLLKKEHTWWENHSMILKPQNLTASWPLLTSPRGLASFFPVPDVPSSRLAPDDSEPWDSRRPLLPEKSGMPEKHEAWNFPSTLSPEDWMKWGLTVVEVCQLSLLGAFSKAPIAGPWKKHASPAVPGVLSAVLVQRPTGFALEFFFLWDTESSDPKGVSKPQHPNTRAGAVLDLLGRREVGAVRAGGAVLGGGAARDVIWIGERPALHLRQHALLVQQRLQEAGVAVELHQVENLKRAQARKDQRVCGERRQETGYGSERQMFSDAGWSHQTSKSPVFHQS